MSPELQTLSIGLTTLVICWLLHSTTDIAYWIGLKQEPRTLECTYCSWVGTPAKAIRNLVNDSVPTLMCANKCQLLGEDDLEIQNVMATDLGQDADGQALWWHDENITREVWRNK